jgi:hypothetical protein
MKKWVKPKGRSMVLVEEEQAEMIIKENYELRNPKKKEVKKKVVKKKEIKEEMTNGNN